MEVHKEHPASITHGPNTGGGGGIGMSESMPPTPRLSWKLPIAGRFKDSPEHSVDITQGSLSLTWYTTPLKQHSDWRAQLIADCAKPTGMWLCAAGVGLDREPGPSGSWQGCGRPCLNTTVIRVGAKNEARNPGTQPTEPQNHRITEPQS